jgi:hypothetical protein
MAGPEWEMMELSGCFLVAEKQISFQHTNYISYRL